MRFIYPAVFKKNENGSYHATFPDLAGCEADGDSFEEIMKRANEAMYDWIDLELHEEDPNLPPATEPEEIKTEKNESVHRILVHYRMVEGWDE